MVRRAEEVSGKPAGLVLGGYHLRNASAGTIETIVYEFLEMGVRQVAPSHCTGDRAIALFRETYGTDCIASGCGRVLQVSP